MKTGKKLSPKSQAAWDTFRARLEELGATLVEPEWLGATVGHKVTCSAGHTGYPVPHTLRPGRSRVCLECPLPAFIAAGEKFRARVEELGGAVLDTEWRGSRHKYAVRCSEGHVTRIWPIGLHQGRGICRVCSFRTRSCSPPEEAWERFKAQVERLGGVVLEGAWKGKDEPHACLCSKGHKCTPRPGHVNRGVGMCRTCAGSDPHVAEAAFRARVAELGGDVLEPIWLGSGKPHRVLCSEGHECTPTPSAVQRGGGICRMCAGKRWDVFYVVTDEDANTVKFGVTSGDPRPRLKNHARDGFNTIVRWNEQCLARCETRGRRQYVVANTSRGGPWGWSLTWLTDGRRRLLQSKSRNSSASTLPHSVGGACGGDPFAGGATVRLTRRTPLYLP